MTFGASLPRSAELTSLVLDVGDASEPITERDAQDLSKRMEAGLAAQAKGMPAARTERLVIDAYRLSLALRRPETIGGAEEEEFRHSVRTVRRAIGMAALARLVRRPNSSAAAIGSTVAEVLAEAEDARGAPDAASYGAGRPAWWAGWFSDLHPAAKAAVAAGAVTWTTGMWTALDWDRVERVNVGSNDVWWDAPARYQTALRSSAELRVIADGGQVLVVAKQGHPYPEWRVELGFHALVPCLKAGLRAVPSRVVGYWPASGQVRVLDPDPSVLLEALDASLVAIAVWSSRS
jgi:hypothetical protein